MRARAHAQAGSLLRRQLGHQLKRRCGWGAFEGLLYVAALDKASRLHSGLFRRGRPSRNSTRRVWIPSAHADPDAAAAFDPFVHALGSGMRAALGARAYPLLFGEDHEVYGPGESQRLEAALPVIGAAWPPPPTCRFVYLAVVREPLSFHLAVWSYFRSIRKRHPSWLRDRLPCLEARRERGAFPWRCPLQLEMAFPALASARAAHATVLPDGPMRSALERPFVYVGTMERLAESCALLGSALGLPSGWLGAELLARPHTSRVDGAASAFAEQSRTSARREHSRRQLRALGAERTTLRRAVDATRAGAAGAAAGAPAAWQGHPGMRRLELLPSSEARLQILAQHVAEMRALPDPAGTKARIAAALADDHRFYALADAQLDRQLSRALRRDPCFAPPGASARSYVERLKGCTLRRPCAPGAVLAAASEAGAIVTRAAAIEHLISEADALCNSTAAWEGAKRGRDGSRAHSASHARRAPEHDGARVLGCDELQLPRGDAASSGDPYTRTAATAAAHPELVSGIRVGEPSFKFNHRGPRRNQSNGRAVAFPLLGMVPSGLRTCRGQ